MKKISVRPGFSLPEVLVATVLLGVIGGALTKLVVTQMRFFDNVSAVRGARSVARNSMNVMLSDLRMVQDKDGVVAASTDSITVRVPYRVGVLCGSTGSVTTVSMLPVDSAVLAGAKYAGWAWRSRSTGLYTLPTVSDPVGSPPSSPGSTATCTGANIKTITVSSRAGGTFDLTPAIASTIAVGSPIYFYQKITYKFAASNYFPGKRGLWRSVAYGGVTEELMAPFNASSGFKYYTSGSDASTTTVPSDLNTITGVSLVLNAVGSRTPAGRTSPPQQDMTTAVFFKNVH